MQKGLRSAFPQVRGPLRNTVAGEGFEPSKLSRRIYSPLPLAARATCLSFHPPAWPEACCGERIAQHLRRLKNAATAATGGEPMADSSFDIVSKIDRQEVDNALGQAAREIATRFDFKGTGASIEWQGDHAIEITASADDRASAVLDVFKGKLVKRNQSLKILDAGEPRQSGQVSKISITLKEGISSEDAKKVTKLIRDEGPKGVKAQIQGDELRISSKKRDDLQAVQALVKSQDYDFAVQFTNYR